MADVTEGLATKRRENARKANWRAKGIDCWLAEMVPRARFRVMSAAKDEAVELIKRLPEDATMEDIQHHLYVLEKIKQGQNRIVAEGGISQDAMERDMARWILS